MSNSSPSTNGHILNIPADMRVKTASGDQSARIAELVRALPRWPGDVPGGTPNVGLKEVNRFLILVSGILTEYLSRAAPISAKPNIPRDRASKSSPPTNAAL